LKFKYLIALTRERKAQSLEEKMFALAVLLFAVAVVASDGAPSHDRGEENAALKALQAKLASQKMALARLVDAKRQNGQKMALAQLVDAKRQNDAESRQADVEDAVREIVASEIESHDEDDNLDEKIQELQEMILHQQDMIKTLLICVVNVDNSDLVTSVVYNGTAGASSHWSSSYVAENAFKGSNSKRWASTSTLPAKLWYNFTSPVKVVMISFKPPFESEDYYLKEVPKTFKLIASNDCTNWHVLLTVKNSAFTTASQVKSWKIPCDQQKSYKCYGIEGTVNSGYSTWDGISLTDVRMFRASK